jgi:hypothetical protein
MKFPTTKFGLKDDPRGAQIKLELDGRTYLGDVRGSHYDETLGVVVLHVTFFNGEPWPFRPAAGAVDVLEREEQACARCGLPPGVHGHGETGREDSHPFEDAEQ